MTQEQQLELALRTLEDYVKEMAVTAEKGEEYGARLWEGIKASNGVLHELAYYHDYGKILCRHQVAGYTLADILIWQVDHFKAYMDRHDKMNRYRRERLFLESLEVMLQMEKNPQPYVDKMMTETGTDKHN